MPVRSAALLCALVLCAAQAARANVDTLPSAPAAATRPAAPAAGDVPESPNPIKPAGDPNPEEEYELPFFGVDARKSGATLPLPVGLTVIGQYQREDIRVHDLQVGLVGGQPLIDASFVGFNGLTTRVRNLMARGDIWLFPFLNLYGIAGESWSSTTVSITRPVNVITEVDSQGVTLGFGGTLAWGIEGWGFVTVDANLTWSDQEILSSPQRTLTVTPRVGHRFVSESNQARAYTIWMGASMEEFESQTVGSIPLNSALPGGSNSSIISLLPSDFAQWEGTLTPAQRASVSQLFGQFIQAQQGPNAANSRAQFSLDLNPRKAWNMVLGGSMDLNRHWQLMGEGGFFGSRTSVMGNISYRFGI